MISGVEAVEGFASKRNIYIENYYELQDLVEKLKRKPNHNLLLGFLEESLPESCWENFENLDSIDKIENLGDLYKNRNIKETNDIEINGLGLKKTFLLPYGILILLGLEFKKDESYKDFKERISVALRVQNAIRKFNKRNLPGNLIEKGENLGIGDLENLSFSEGRIYLWEDRDRSLENSLKFLAQERVREAIAIEEIGYEVMNGSIRSQEVLDTTNNPELLVLITIIDCINSLSDPDFLKSAISEGYNLLSIRNTLMYFSIPMARTMSKKLNKYFVEKNISSLLIKHGAQWYYIDVFNSREVYESKERNIRVKKDISPFLGILCNLKNDNGETITEVKSENQAQNNGEANNIDVINNLRAQEIANMKMKKFYQANAFDSSLSSLLSVLHDAINDPDNIGGTINGKRSVDVVDGFCTYYTTVKKVFRYPATDEISHNFLLFLPYEFISKLALTNPSETETQIMVRENEFREYICFDFNVVEDMAHWANLFKGMFKNVQFASLLGGVNFKNKSLESILEFVLRAFADSLKDILKAHEKKPEKNVLLKKEEPTFVSIVLNYYFGELSLILSILRAHVTKKDISRYENDYLSFKKDVSYRGLLLYLIQDLQNLFDKIKKGSTMNVLATLIDKDEIKALKEIHTELLKTDFNSPSPGGKQSGKKAIETTKKIAIKYLEILALTIGRWHEVVNSTRHKDSTGSKVLYDSTDFSSPTSFLIWISMQTKKGIHYPVKSVYTLVSQILKKLVMLEDYPYNYFYNGNADLEEEFETDTGMFGLKSGTESIASIFFRTISSTSCNDYDTALKELIQTYCVACLMISEIFSKGHKRIENLDPKYAALLAKVRQISIFNNLLVYFSSEIVSQIKDFWTETRTIGKTKSLVRNTSSTLGGVTGYAVILSFYFIFILGNNPQITSNNDVDEETSFEHIAVC